MGMFSRCVYKRQTFWFPACFSLKSSPSENGSTVKWTCNVFVKHYAPNYMLVSTKCQSSKGTQLSIFSQKVNSWSTVQPLFLHHWGVQLILAYSWARSAILVVGKGRGGMFLFLLFLHFHSCSSFFPVPLFHLLYSLFYLFSPFLWETTQNDPQGLTCR